MTFIYTCMYFVKNVQSRSGVTLEWKGFDNKMGTILASARALCLDLLLCVVTYFRRTELLPGVSERNGID